MQVFVAGNATYNSLCRSVGRSVGWSVTHSFDDPHVAHYCLLGLVSLYLFFFFFFLFFLYFTQLYKGLCPSIGPSVMIELESVKMRIFAPAYLSATRIGRVSSCFSSISLLSFSFFQFPPFFLAAETQLFQRLCLSVRQSVGL